MNRRCAQPELRPSDAPESAKALDLEQAKPGDDDDSGRDCQGELLEDRCEEEQRQQHEGGADHAEEVAGPTGVALDEAARLAAIDRDALQEAGGDVRGANGEELLIGIERVATGGRQRACRQEAVRIGEEGDAERGEQQLGELIERGAGQRR